MVQVFVKSGDVEKALRLLKRKLSEDGDQKRLKQRRRFMPADKRKRRKMAKTARKR
jgi:ribosomal protein S21